MITTQTSPGEVWAAIVTTQDEFRASIGYTCRSAESVLAADAAVRAVQAYAAADSAGDQKPDTRGGLSLSTLQAVARGTVLWSADGSPRLADINEDVR